MRSMWSVQAHVRSRYEVEVCHYLLGIKEVEDVIQLLALGDAKNNGKFLYRWVLGLHLLDDGLETVDVVAHVQDYGLLAALYSLEAAWLCCLAN